MSPQCLGNANSSGRWVCPYCLPCLTPKNCFTTHSTLRGTVNVPCTGVCSYSKFRGATPAELHAHVLDVHKWDGVDLSLEPPRKLRIPQATRIIKGPSNKARLKARAKRKKKKK